MPYDTLSPCVANALSGIRTITVAGKPVGIAGLPAAFAAIDAKGLTVDAEISAELMRRVAKRTMSRRPLRESTQWQCWPSTTGQQKNPGPFLTNNE